MNEEELKKGCGRTFDINDPNYITFCGVTCHTQHPDDLGLGVDLCIECRAKLSQRQEDVKEELEFLELLYKHWGTYVALERLKERIKSLKGEEKQDD